VVTIVNSHQLQLISTQLGQNYVLGSNIDLSETGAVTAGTPSSYAGMWNSAGFVPIGYSYDASANNFLGTPFTGNFNGKGYSIGNLFIDLPGAFNVGLFSGLGNGASVNSVNLISVQVTGGYFTGGLIGDIPNPTGVSVTNSVVSGVVSGTADGTGGLIGALYGPNVTVSADRTFGTVNGVQDVGGLVGFVWYASISKSSSSANVNGSMFATGGLVGSEFSGNIDQSFATGAVAGNGNVGGLVGDLGFNGQSASITNSYATGNVTLISSSEYSVYSGLGVGGLVGTAFNGSVTNSYESGQVIAIGVPGVGGLIGTSPLAPLSVVSSFYNSDFNSAGAYGAGSTGLTTAQMQNFTTYASTYAGWDFANVWAPPTQAGQAGQTSAYYPQLYADTPVVFTVAAIATRTYGANNPALGTVSGGPASYAFGPGGDSLPQTSLFSTTATTASGVNQYAITPVAANSVNSTLGVAYRVIDAGTAGSLTIDPAPLTVTYAANSATGTYGSAIPVLSGTEAAVGLVNGDTLTSVTSGTASFATSATSASNVGSYAVTGSGLSANSGNYTFTFQQAAGNATALTINPAPLLVTYTATAATAIYGSALPTLSGSETATGLVNGDSLASVTAGTAGFTTTATSGANAGTYAVTGSGLSANSGNYTFTFQQAAGNATALTINPALLLVTYTANTATTIYGSALPTLSGSETATGLVNGDTLALVTAGTAGFTTTATSGANAGTYAVTGSGLSANSGNYTFTFQQAPGNATALAINPAPLLLTYTANTATGTYGAAIPTLSGTETAAGLVNGDTLATALGGTAAFSTAATSASNVGSYAVTGGGLSSNGNYILTVHQAPGNASAFTINPAPLLVTYTADSATGTYGAAIPTLSGTETAAGLVNGDTLTSVTAGTASFATNATSASNVGSYAVTGSGLSANSANYTFTFQQAAGNATALTIDPAPLLVTYTAGAASVTYGSAIPALSGSETATGLVNGNTLASVTSGSASFATTATSTSNAGSYAVTGSGLTANSGNYSVTFQQAAGNATALAINPAPLLVTYAANAASGTYGAAIPALSGSETATGLVNGDTLAAVTGGTATFNTNATSASNVGSYAVTGSGLSGNSANYNVTFQQAAGNASAFTINARLVTVTADDLEKAFAAPNPVLTYVIAPADTNTGLINGATLSGMLATTATQSSPSGTYAITQGTLTASSNYNIVFIGGTLKVDLPPLQSLNAFLDINSPVLSGQNASSNPGNGTKCSPIPSAVDIRKGDVVITNTSPGGGCAN
jgi:hypothetical protein